MCPESAAMGVLRRSINDAQHTLYANEGTESAKVRQVHTELSGARSAHIGVNDSRTSLVSSAPQYSCMYLKSWIWCTHEMGNPTMLEFI